MYQGLIWKRDNILGLDYYSFYWRTAFLKSEYERRFVELLRNMGYRIQEFQGADGKVVACRLENVSFPDMRKRFDQLDDDQRLGFDDLITAIRLAGFE